MARIERVVGKFKEGSSKDGTATIVFRKIKAVVEADNEKVVLFVGDELFASISTRYVDMIGGVAVKAIDTVYPDGVRMLFEYGDHKVVVAIYSGYAYVRVGDEQAEITWEGGDLEGRWKLL